MGVISSLNLSSKYLGNDKRQKLTVFGKVLDNCILYNIAETGSTKYSVVQELLRKNTFLRKKVTLGRGIEIF